MLSKYYFVGISLVLAVAGSNVALADQPGKDWISMDKVIAILKKDGYTQITEIEADDGHWEGEGIKNGKLYEWHVNPHTGKITKSERDENGNDHD